MAWTDAYGSVSENLNFGKWGPMLPARGGGFNSGISESAVLRARAAQLAAKYLEQWNQALNTASGYYNDAAEGVAKSLGILDKGVESIGDLDDVYADVKSSWNKYKTDYAGLKTDAIAAAQEDIDNRRKVIGNLMGLTTADYEGEAGRAKADVSAETERGRRATEREMAGLGINPASRNYAESIRKTRVQEALNKVLAGNTARLAEKARITDANKTAADVISSGISNSPASIAQGISTGELDYLKEMGDLKGKKVDSYGNLASTGGGLASTMSSIAGGYAQNIANPLGEMYATNQGLAMSLNPQQYITGNSWLNGGMGRSKASPLTGITLKK